MDNLIQALYLGGIAVGAILTLTSALWLLEGLLRIGSKGERLIGWVLVVTMLPLFFGSIVLTSFAYLQAF